jgi:hypothetical protein
VRKIWNGKKKCISVLVLAFAVFAMAFTSAYGASGINTNAEASITFGIETTYSELQNADTKFTVTLYKVADVEVSGKYRVAAPFSGNETLKKGLENVSASTTNWADYAAEAKNVVDGLTDAKRAELNPETFTVTVGNDTLKVDVGLYLVVVGTIETATYEYTALPFLISVPGNDYGKQGATDAWIYTVSCNIKFEPGDRYGTLTIEKNLKNYNASLGTATFVYEVTATKDYSAVGKGTETVYNNVVTIDFSKAGTEKYTIDIPAGANVTVEEVYSGASYSAEETGPRTAEITAGKTAKVSFTNDYNKALLYQDTVVNHFSYDSEEKAWNLTNSSQGGSSQTDLSQTTGSVVPD